MLFTSRLVTLAAGSFVFSIVNGSPIPRSQAASTLSSIEARANSYTTFGGDGTTANGWPAQSAWTSFDTMFSNNQAVMQAGCAQFGVPNNSAGEIADIKTAINSVASSTGVDARFILAILLQESNGCVRAPTTNYGVVNPGLMQSHDGAGSCNNGGVLTPCPAGQITQMVTDGTAGTSSGDGLKQCIAESGATDVSMYYSAARIYNSGSIASVNGVKNLGAGIATHCYASDIANRLTGWFSGPTGCDPNTVENVVGSASSAAAPPAAAPPAAAPPAAPTTAPGGVFAAIPTPTPAAVPVPAAPKPAPAAPAAPVAPVAPPPPPPASTATVVPVPAATAKAGSGSSSAGAVTAGTACSPEGLWNCIGGNSFQQCASGTWSAVESLAAGMQCTVGQSTVFSISAVA